jgi:hypothetical protein
MERSLMDRIIALKLEALNLIVHSLPEPLRDQAARNVRELIEAVHSMTGEYLAREGRAEEKNVLRRVDIQ